MLIHDYHMTTLVHRPETRQIDLEAGKILQIDKSPTRQKKKEEEGRNSSHKVSYLPFQNLTSDFCPKC